MKLLKKLKWGLFAFGVFIGVNTQAQYAVWGTPWVRMADTSVRDRIYAAASVGNVAELKRLASLGYSLELTDANGNTAYCQAVWSQSRVAVAALIEAGVNVRPSCLKRIPYVTESRIYAAAHAEDLDQLVAWKKEGLNVDVVNPRTGDSALCEAVYNYDCPAIQTLLRAGSLQAQPCMRRIPQEVREKLQCRPLKIDWTTIGYTVLGVGMAGALVAILGSGDGNGNPTCPPTQRWNGDKCISCDTCWIGTQCISKTEMNKKPYYRDETNAECWTVAPPPVKMSDDELVREVEKIEEDPRYQKGHYLDPINAAEAYARGYNGYMVERTSPYGRLVNKQVSPGVDPTLTDKKVTLAIYSDGMTIGNGGTIEQTTTSGSSSGKVTYNVWNFDKVNKAFYDSNSSAAQTWSGDKYTVNKEGPTVPGMDASKQASGTNVSTLGSVANNFALTDSDPAKGHPYGFNFDYGVCAKNDSGAYIKKNCYYGVSENLGATKPYGLAKFARGTTELYILENTITGQIIGTTTTPPVHCAENTASNCVQNYARWQVPGTSDEHGGAATVDGGILARFNYTSDYVYNVDDPTPHYIDNTGKAPITGSLGTFLAGIAGAMKLDNDPNAVTYGVAYNTAILPVSRDVVQGLSLEAMNHMTANADIILSAEALNINESVDPEVTTALGGFTKDGTKYTAKKISEVLGPDAPNVYRSLSNSSSKGKVMIVSNGSGQASDKWSIKQPTIQSAVPLYAEMNSGTVWNSTSKLLPSVDATNPLYHLYITVGSIDSVTQVDDTKLINATPSAYSQPCGIAGSYCVMAYGGQSADSAHGIYSTTDPTLNSSTSGYSYTYSYGTASAAASVAGSVALLMGAYPHLTSQQIVEILFKTSTYITPTDAQVTLYGDTYAAGSDELGSYNSIFGRGLINLAAATEPVGGKNGLWVYRNGTAIGQGTVVTASSTRLIAPAPLTAASALGSALPSHFVAFDAYNRPFQVPTAGLFDLKNRRKTKSWDDFKMFMRGRDPIEIQPTENFSMMYRNQTNRVSSSSQIPMSLVQMNLKQNKMRYSLFYSQDTTMGKEAYWKRRMTNPFIQMRDAFGIETGYDLNSKWSVEVGWTTGKNGFFDDDDRHFDAPDNKMQAFTSAVVFKPIDKVSFKVATGVMKETGASLGMVSEGAFNIKGANTHFVGAGVAITPIDKVRLEAMYYYGQTKTSSDGGLMNLSRMASDSFAMTASYQPSDDHLFGLQVSSPLRVRKGTLNVSLPVGRHPTEDIYYYDTYKANMKPKAREIDLSMYYQGNMTDEVSLQSEMGVRLNPDHQADVSPDYRGMVGVKWNY